MLIGKAIIDEARMSATLQQATLDPAAEGLDQLIQAKVTVCRDLKDGTYFHTVPALAAAGRYGSSWRVVWTLATADQTLRLCFRNNGIIVPKPGTKMPIGVTDLCPCVVSPQESHLTFINNVSDVNVIRYDLDFDVTDQVSGNLLARRNIKFDPTIAVVQEPIDGY
jgi:hypothetical protein